MKMYAAMFGLSLAISACTQTGTVKLRGDSTRQDADSLAIAGTETLCFERYSGNRNQDTASIRLVLKGNNVSGSYANIPYEKDARIGTISGTRSGNVMKGIWRFQQEGMSDSVGFEWKIEDDMLLQKQTGFDSSSGREVLSDTAAFSQEYLRVDCQSLNSRIR